MKTSKNWLIVGALASASALVGCDDSGPDNTMQDSGPANFLTINGNITEDTTWHTGQTIELGARIYVENGATLTIEPGVIVQGNRGSALVITRSSHLVAEGTKEQPIVMTSSAPEGFRQASDWGGLVLFGKAPTNQGSEVVFEGLTAEERNTYGGNDAAWNCGSIRYLRVEFAGQVFAPGKEFNGITFAGCGSQTRASYVEVLNGADDGIEFFGGSANVDHALIVAQDDDGLDWDFGWTGHIQYYIVQGVTGIASDNAIEADNNATGLTTAPRSQPTIYNGTFLGLGKAPSGKAHMINIRRASLGVIRNSIFQNYTHATDAQKAGLQIEPPVTSNEAESVYQGYWDTAGTLRFEYSFFPSVNLPATTVTADGDLPRISGTMNPDTTYRGSFALRASLTDAARHNTTDDYTVPATPVRLSNLVDVGTGTVPNLCAITGTAAVSGSPDPGAGFPNFDAAGLAYAGACAPGTAGADAWYAGWASFRAN